MVGNGFKINKSGIERMARDIQKEFDRHPVRVPVEAGAQSAASGASGGDAGSAVAVAASCILDWLYAVAPDDSGNYVDLDELLAEHEDHPLLPLIRETGRIAVDSLAADDLVDQLNTFARSLPFMITDAGRRAAVRQIEQRGNRRARTLACREAVLHWAYSQGTGEALDVQDMGTTPAGWFCADQFRVQELAQAVAFLAGEDLVRGKAAAFTLTADGVKVVEQFGSLVEFQNRPQGAGVSVVFTGDNNGQLAIGNRDVQQNQSQENDAKVLGVFANALREFAGLLPEDQREEFYDVATSLEREAAKDEPDKGWIKSLLERGRGLLGRSDDFKNLAEVARVGLDVYNSTLGG
jgi:hypothetical protein